MIGQMRYCSAEMGHVNLGWDAKHEERMLAFIEKKMKEGIRFWFVGPRLADNFEVSEAKQLAGKHVVSFDTEDLERLGAPIAQVDVRDPELNTLLKDGVIRLARPDGKALANDKPAAAGDKPGFAKTAKEVVRRSTVALRPLAGG